LITSDFLIFPSFAEAFTLLTNIVSCELIIADANGVILVFLGLLSLDIFFFVVSIFFTFTFFASPMTEVSIRHTTSPTATVSPFSTNILILPLSSAGSSNVALSESISAIA